MHDWHSISLSLTEHLSKWALFLSLLFFSEDATLIASVIRNTSLTGKCCPQANLGKVVFTSFLRKRHAFLVYY